MYIYPPYPLTQYHGMSWGPSSSYLSSINFNYNSSWCFVIKFAITDYSVNGMQWNFNIDDSTATWYNNSASGQNQGLAYLWTTPTLSSSNIFTGYLLSNITTNITTIKQNMQSGIYLNISYNYSTTTIKLEFTSLTGTILGTSTGTFTFVNKVLPWSLYDDGDGITYYKGIYYNSTGYVPWSTYSNYI